MVQTAQGFGELLKVYRRRAGMTQEELAEAAELSPRGFIYLERGERSPQPGTARRLADALGLTGEERTAFLGGSESAEVPEAAPEAPGALPAQPTPFVGREDELSRVLAMLRREDIRLVTLWD